MNQYKLWWTKTAQKNLIDIIDYIIESDNKNTAKKIYSKIKDRCELLASSPEQGRFVPEFRDLGIEKYRELIIAPWRIIYKYDDENIYILLVIDARRNVEDILFDLIIKNYGT